MEVFRFKIRPEQEIEKLETFKTSINNCPICGTTMVFDYEVDYLYNKIQESCRCPACQSDIRQEAFPIQ